MSTTVRLTTATAGRNNSRKPASIDTIPTISRHIADPVDRVRVSDESSATPFTNSAIGSISDAAATAASGAAMAKMPTRIRTTPATMAHVSRLGFAPVS